MSCTFLGSDASICHLKAVEALDDLPQSCSSFIFEGLTVNLTHDIFQAYSKDDSSNNHSFS